MRVPGYVVGAFFIFLLSFAMAFLAAWADLLPEFMPASAAFFVLVAAACVVLPTGRKNGGCGLGCGLYIVASVGVIAGMSCFPSRPQTRPIPRESLPVPRFLRGVTPTVDGVALGMTRPQVGALKLVGTRLQFAGGRVVRVEGSVLAQSGRVLVRAGDTIERATEVMQPGMMTRDVFRREGYTFTMHGPAGQVQTISLSRGD